MHQTVETIVGICDLCLGLGRVSSSPLNDSVCLFSRILRVGSALFISCSRTQL